jgi:SAM-dependent methyltransferase
MDFDFFKDNLGWGDTIHSKTVFDFYVKVAKFSEGKVVLDVGAGYQPYRSFFEKSLYVTLEHQESGVIKKGIIDANIVVADNQIPLLDNSVSTIFSTSSLEHFEDPVEFFKESARVLAPGGGLFIQVPFMYEEHEAPFHFQHFTQFGLRRLFKINEFQSISVQPSSSSIFAAEYLLGVALEDDFPKSIHLGKKGSSLIKSKLKNIRRRTSLRLVRTSLNLLTLGNDRHPSSRTRMPIGYLAEGYKSGETVPPNYKVGDHAKFLKEKLLKNSGYTYFDKKIVVKRNERKSKST